MDTPLMDEVRRRGARLRRWLLAPALAVGVGLLSAGTAFGQDVKVLVFHPASDAVADAGVAAIEALGDANDFEVDATTNAGAFTASNLAGYRAVVFLNNEGDRLNAAQESALQAYIQGGGGFVGIGRAAEAEPNSTFVTGLIGARPASGSSATVTEQVVAVGDRVHPATRSLPLEWTRSDSWYQWTSRPTGQVHTLARYRAPGAPAGDGTTTGGTDWPISWCRDFQGGRSFFTGMGRTVPSYEQASFRQHLLGGIQWAAGLVRGNCKATIAANYSGERLVNAASGTVEHTAEPHGLSIAPNGWVIYIGRADCRTNAQRGAMIGVASSPIITNFNNPNVGVGCGTVHIWDPAQHTGAVNSGVTLAGILPVYGDRGSGNEINGKIESGLLGVTVAPNFMETGHIYLLYFPTFNPNNPVHPGLPDGDQRRITKMGKGRISRFTIDLQTKQLKLDSEVVIFEYDSQIYSCCHRGGGMAFDSEGNLYVTTGDSNSSQSTNGYSGNYQPARCPTGDPTVASNNHCGSNNISYNDARRTAGSTNDYNGKMLRINPIDSIPDGAKIPPGIGTTYTLPTASSPNGPNLFDGTEGNGNQTKPEIYAMGLRNPSRMAIDPKTDVPYAAWVGPDAGSPSATQGPSTYENAAQIAQAGNYGWPYCMGNQQAYRDRVADGSLRTSNAQGYVSGGPANSPTQGWYDCKNLVNDSTNNTGLTVLPHETGTGRDAGTARPVNIWYSRGNPGGNNGCPDFPRPLGEDAAPNYGATPTQKCPYLTASGATIFSGPVYRYDDDATDDSVRWPKYWDGRWFLHDHGNQSAKHALLLDPATDQDGGQPVYADSFRNVLNWSGNYMDSKFGPDGAYYVQVYQGFFSTGPDAGLYRYTYTGGPDTPSPDPQWSATSTPRQIQFGLGSTGGVSYRWDFGDGTPESTEPTPTHTYAETGTYTATLTVTYADGEVLSKSTTVSVTADSTAPTVVAQINGSTPASTYTAPVEVSLIASDGEGGSGVEWTEYRIDNGAWTRRDNTTGANPFVTTFNVTSAGQHTVEFRARDVAGNQTDPPGSITFRINLSAPACLPQSDEFDGDALDPKWTVLRPAGGGPVVGGGNLTLPILQGDFIANDPLASNTLLQDAPDGEWTFTVRLNTAGINANGEQAGIVIWKSESPNVFSKIVAIQSSGGNRQFEHIVTQNGSVSPPISSSITQAPGNVLPENVLLRARYDGTKVIGEFSADDGETWTLIGQTGHAAPLTAPLRVGVVAFRGSQGGGNVTFDWARMHGGSSPETPIVCGSACSPQSDQFDGDTLDPKWSVINSLNNATLVDGRLRIPLVQSDLYGNTATAQVFVQDAPSGSWVATAKVAHASIDVDGEAVGLALINSINPNHFLKTTLQYKNDTNPQQGGNQPGKWAERVLTSNGTAITLPPDTVPWPNSGALNPSDDYVWVRFVHDATTGQITTWTSTDGTTFASFGPPISVAQYLNQPGGLRVGVFAKRDGSGGGFAEIEAFNLVPGSADPQVPGDDCGGGSVGDTTPPSTTSALSPATPDGSDGWYKTPVQVTLTATDNEGGAGVEYTEYRAAGAPTWTTYDGPFTISADGSHTIEYRSVDLAGNTESTRSVSFKIDKAAPTTTAKLNGAEPQASYDGDVAVDLDATDATSGVKLTEIRVDGGEWKPYVEEETILNSAADLARWRQAGPGSLNWVDAEGGFARTSGGLGMPWYPVKDYGDFSLKLQWRDSSSGNAGNGGVFVRFPHPEEAIQRAPQDRYPCQVGSATNDPAWVAIYCGHEIQINDNQTSEPQKTGSVYNFSPLNTTQAMVQPRGTWVDYEVRVVGQTYTIIRNGQVLQTFENSPGKQSSRSGDPSTTDRQFSRGYIGLQNHGTSDLIDYRNVRVLPLDEGSVQGPVTVSGEGRHTVEFRSTDVAGNVEEVKSVEFTIGDVDATPPVTTASLDPASPGAGGTYSGPVGVMLSAIDPDGVGGGGAPRTHDIDAAPSTWEPASVAASVGDTVRFNFPSTAGSAHDLWLLRPDEPLDGDGTLMLPESFPIKLPGDPPVTQVVDEPGTWTFVCKVHSFRSEGRWQGMVASAVVADGPTVPGSGVDYTEYRVNNGEWVRNTNTAGVSPFVTGLIVSEEGAYTIDYRSVDKAGNAEAVKSVSFTIDLPEGSVEEEESVVGTVPLALSLSLSGPVNFGLFTPGVAQDYVASTTVTAISSAPSAALTVSDRSTIATGHMVNGETSLPQRLQVGTGGAFAPLGGADSPTLVQAFNTPLANEVIELQFKQSIAATDRLLVGTYSKRVTLTLSATTP
jgi:glucose/arabinose dehydrogenase/type 1 glutamine amidotransferase/plastocyanin